MKKRFLALSLSLAMALSLLLSACGNTSSGGENKDLDKVYELSFTIHDPATSAKVKYYESLAEQTKEATNGKVVITVYSGGSLLAPTDVAEGVLTGAADIGWLYTAFFPGQFPLTEAISLPMLFEDHGQATEVFNDLYEQSEELRARSEEHTSELQSHSENSQAVFGLRK